MVHFNRLKPFFSHSNDANTNQRVNILNHCESDPSCIPEEDEILIPQEENIDSEPSLRRSTRIRQPVDRYGEFVSHYINLPHMREKCHELLLNLSFKLHLCCVVYVLYDCSLSSSSFNSP